MNVYSNAPPAAIGSWVTPSTPSMSLRSAMPCQCTLVSLGSWLSTVTRSRSPAVARIRGPGTLSPYAQVDTVRPPRSIWVGCGRQPGGDQALTGAAAGLLGAPDGLRAGTHETPGVGATRGKARKREGPGGTGEEGTTAEFKGH